MKSLLFGITFGVFFGMFSSVVIIDVLQIVFFRNLRKKLLELGIIKRKLLFSLQSVIKIRAVDK